MIEKERLKELIEQGATVYELFMNKEILKVELNKNYYIMLDKIYENKLGKLPQRPHWLSDLFETKEDAEWFAEFGCIERTERLELPTWENIKEDFIDNKRELGNYVVCEFDDCSIDIVVCCTGDIMISIYEINFYKELTKENYTLACRKAKELFLGENK